jgi:hypothetical protein
MKLMTIRNVRSLWSPLEMFGRILRSIQSIDCDADSAIALISREHPFFISYKLKEPVNGDNDMMTMLGSIDVNTRLRVSIIDTGSVKEYLINLFRSIKSFLLPGRDTQNLDTP